MKYSEEDMRAQKIDPSLEKSGWKPSQIRREVSFTDGRIIVRGIVVSRGKPLRADYILQYKSNIPLAIIEAKDNEHRVFDGLEQAKKYAEKIGLPFCYATNGDAFVEYDFSTGKETMIEMDNFPTPEKLYERYLRTKGIQTEEEKSIVAEEYFIDTSGRTPRYFQARAVNEVVEHVAKGKKRMMLVMATGTGKTYTAFQIIYRLWKSRTKKRILFLVDRKALAYQTMQKDFRPFGEKMTLIKNRKADHSYEVYISLYQGITGNEEEKQLFREFSQDFFDLVVIDECHRGGINEDGTWREVLDYFSHATHIGLTATPKSIEGADNYKYFGEPVYTYSLKQGIEDGFLAPYRVVRYIMDKDIEWRPDVYIKDQDGDNIEDGVYNVSDYNKKIIVEDRINEVADKITEYLQETDPMQKTIIFCANIEHAERMRQALVQRNPQEMKKNRRYIMRMTGDEKEGKREIENFINPESPYPTIVTTSELLTTGVDAQTCRLIVLDSAINSMTKFKQIIGRGTRINSDFDKYYFTILDFSGATRLFADKDFDGEPVRAIIKDNESEELDPKEINETSQTPEEIREEYPEEEILLPRDEEEEKKKTRIVIQEGQVDFNVIHRVVSIIDPKTGKLTTESLVTYASEQLKNRYQNLEDFLNDWNKDIRKTTLIQELIGQGILFDELKKEIGMEDIDEFDIIMHLAYDKKPLTRKERVDEVKKRDIFTKYEGIAQKVIEALLEKYADQGVEAIDGIEDLKVAPFITFGSQFEIVEAFGGRDHYLEAVQEIQNHIYQQQK